LSQSPQSEDDQKRDDARHQDALHRASLVLRLRSMGITDRRIVSAFEATRREAFTPSGYAADAYAERLVPIACGQVMEAPLVLARLVQAASIAEGAVVLEIGTGSGYFSALLAKLARRVITLERYRSLADAARGVLERQRVSNVDVVLADGLNGWPSAAPYQAIFVSGSVQGPPQVWLDQLAPGGTLIAPVGPPTTAQSWISFTKDAAGTMDQQVLDTAFATALEPGLARAL
jgi:protein-L-isoaspartate(D-aspartate) O-methyltransferase